MSVEILRKRYLAIAKNSLGFLKTKGFQKKGAKYSVAKGELILQIYPEAPRPWSNSDHLYEFHIALDLITTNPDFITIYNLMEKAKETTTAPLIEITLRPIGAPKAGGGFLKSDDPTEKDEKFVEGIIEKIETDILPWFEGLNSIDDVIALAEAEFEMERQQRTFFGGTNIYHKLCNYYATKGWRQKTIAMSERYLEVALITVKDLAAKRIKKYIQYFDSIEK